MQNAFNKDEVKEDENTKMEEIGTDLEALMYAEMETEITEGLESNENNEKREKDQMIEEKENIEPNYVFENLSTSDSTKRDNADIFFSENFLECGEEKLSLEESKINSMKLQKKSKSIKKYTKLPSKSRVSHQNL